MSFIDSLLKPLVGTKPSVPKLTLPDISQTQLDTAKGNAGVLPAAKDLGSSIDTYNLAQLSKALEFLSPGSFGKIQSNISDELSGNINPQDTQAVVRNATAAGYGKGFGFGNGGIGRNLVTRDLGLSVESQKARGMTDFMNLSRIAPHPFDVTSMFFTPGQRLQAATQQSEEQFNRSWLQSQIDAAPSPLGQFIQNVVYAVAGTAGRYFGVSGGGAGGPAQSTSAGPRGSGGGGGGGGSYLNSSDFGSSGSGYSDSAGGGFADAGTGFA